MNNTTVSKTYIFINEDQDLKIEIKKFQHNIYSELAVNGKQVILKLPEGGYVVLLKTIDIKLSSEVRNIIHQSYDDGETVFDLSKIYEDVKSRNKKKYLIKRGVVKTIDGKSLARNIYSTGNKFFYKNKDSEQWFEIVPGDGGDYYVV